ncbi:ABC transporter permease, partial [Prescottella equi]
MSERSGLNPSRAIALVARREFLTQVQKKSFLVSNVIVLIAIIGGIVAASIFSGKDDESRSKVGLVGDQSLSAALVATGDAAGNPVEVTEIGDEQTARTQVEDGDLDVAVVPGSGGAVTAITKSEIDSSLRVVLDGAVAAEAQSAALAAQGVDAAQLAENTASAVVTVDAIDPPDPERGPRPAPSPAGGGGFFIDI